MSFRDIIGQDRAITLMQRAYESKRLAHAYLFVGSEGIGKKRVAMEYVKWINCEAPTPDGACDHCASCNAIAHGTNPDILLFQTEKASISIDDIKALQKDIQYQQTTARYRSIIIDDAEKMTTEAANSFLKTLEEPPRGTIIILITHSVAPMLKTIVSRCHVMRFRMLSDEEKIKILAQCTHSTDIEPIKNALYRAGGVIHAAQGYLENPDDETYAMYAAIEDALHAKTLSSEIFSKLDTFVKDREACKELLHFLIARESERCHTQQTLSGDHIQHLLNVYRALEQNVNPRTLFTWMMLSV